MEEARAIAKDAYIRGGIMLGDPLSLGERAGVWFKFVRPTQITAGEASVQAESLATPAVKYRQRRGNPTAPGTSRPRRDLIGGSLETDYVTHLTPLSKLVSYKVSNLFPPTAQEP